MAAAVRIEAMAFADERIDHLGELAGYNRHEALGRLARLWSYATDKELDVVEEVTIRVHLGPRGVEAITGSSLGEIVEGGIRLRGGERLFWLRKKRENARKGGEAKAAKATRNVPPGTQERSEPYQDPAYRQKVATATACPIVIALSSGTSVPEKTPPPLTGARAMDGAESTATEDPYLRLHRYARVVVERYGAQRFAPDPGPVAGRHRVREAMHHPEIRERTVEQLERALDMIGAQADEKAKTGEDSSYGLLASILSPGVLKAALDCPDEKTARQRAVRRPHGGASRTSRQTTIGSMPPRRAEEFHDVPVE